MELMRRVALAALSSPGWGAGSGGRRRRALRLLGLLGPQGHRTGGSEGAHVRGDLCVVFWRRVCVCHVDTGVCLCVEGCALEEWSVV